MPRKTAFLTAVEFAVEENLLAEQCGEERSVGLLLCCCFHFWPRPMI